MRVRLPPAAPRREAGGVRREARDARRETGGARREAGGARTISGAGIALGLGVAAAFTRSLTALLFALSPLDSVTMAEVAVLLLAAVVAASGIPALRATR